MQGAVTFVLARHRAIDDLILSTESDQVVFLGAGYDSRRARIHDRLCQSRVFEVDHPDTAQRKSRLAGQVYADAKLAPAVPVAIDFTRESIADRLKEAGLEPRARTIWVWEGVSMYLPDRAVRDTLTLFARLSGPGSLAVCDLLSDPRRADFLADAQNQVLELAMEWMYSEPFRWYCPQDEIDGYFDSCGMRILEDIGMDDLVGRYADRYKGWREAAPSLRLVVSEPL
jgi:methyltransferase (TIGR00027 family)